MSQHQNSDTTLTKIYVGGLPWKTRQEGLISFFERFGEIIHANVVCYKATNRSQGYGKSQGYGFVTFRYPESARRACMNPNPTIDGRITNCKLAYIGAANVKQNQYSLIPICHDDLCFTSPSFVQSMQQPSNFHQPLATYAIPQWNQFYPQHPHPQCYNYPQYYPQYDPVSYQHYHMLNTNGWYRPDQSTNTVNEESSSSQATSSTQTEIPSTPRSRPTITISTTSDSGSGGNSQS